MTNQDTCCTIVPYFQVHADQLDSFKELCPKLVAQTSNEPLCLYYGFSFDGDIAHCREGYTNAEGLLNHIEQIGPLLEEILKISDLTRIEIHGPADELAQLREPLAGLSPQFFTLECGFRR